jgi:hypothetical protein
MGNKEVDCIYMDEPESRVIEIKYIHGHVLDDSVV